jgi:EAL domain-containing protein (putative c-di-GMP-specific phosphodiesterase class I)
VFATGEVVGYEALSRFPSLAQRPDAVFAEAWQLGLGAEVEALRAALDAASLLPDHACLSVDVAPATLADHRFLDAVTSGPLSPERVVVEVTEHAVVDDDDALRAACMRLASHGVPAGGR